MPSISMTQVISGYALGMKSFYAVVRYGGSLKVVTYSNHDGFTIIDISQKTAENIGGAYQNATNPVIHRLMNMVIGKSTIKARIAIPTSSGIDIVDFDIDLSAKQVNQQKVKTVTPPNWNANYGQWSMIAEASHVISGRYIIGFDNNGNVTVFDLLEGSELFTVSTNFSGEYWGRPCWKMIVRDDLILLLGRHYAGDPLRIIKLFSKQISEVSPGFSLNTGGSPRPHVGIPLICRRARYYPSTWGGVVGAKNDILVLDDAFNVVFGIDVSKLTPGWSAYDVEPGYGLLGVMNDGSILGYALVENFATTSSGNVARLVLFKVTPPSSPSLVSPTVLAYADIQNIHEEHIDTVGGDYSDGKPVPIVDLANAKIYIIVDRVDFNEVKHYAYIAEVDISDIIDQIVEWNELVAFAKA